MSGDGWETKEIKKKGSADEYPIANAGEWRQVFLKMSAKQGNTRQMLNSLINNANTVVSVPQCYVMIMGSLKQLVELKTIQSHHEKLVKSLIEAYDNATPTDRFDMATIENGVKYVAYFIIFKTDLNKKGIASFSTTTEEILFKKLVKSTDNNLFLDSGAAIMQASKALGLEKSEFNYEMIHPKVWKISVAPESEKSVFTIDLNTNGIKVDVAIFKYAMPYIVQILKVKTEGLIVDDFKGPKQFIWKLLPGNDANGNAMRSAIKQLLEDKDERSGLCFRPELDKQGNFTCTHQYNTNSKSIVYCVDR